MQRSIAILCSSALLLAVAVASRAQDSADSCNVLLRHGIFDSFRSNNIQASDSIISSKICDKYNSLKQTGFGAGATVDIPLVASGSASFSSQSLEAIGKVLCEAASSVVDAQAAQSQASQFIDRAAVDAWAACVKQYDKPSGLRSITTFREDDQAFISISIRYVDPEGNAGQQQVKNITLDPLEAFGCVDQSQEVCSACHDDLWEETRKGGHPNLTSAFLTISCSRRFPANPVKIGDATFLAPAATIVLHTTAGDVVRNLAAVPAPLPPQPPPVIPPGTVVAYAVDVDSKSLVGWLPCDGRSLKKNDFPQLFAAIGNIYGDGKDPTSGKKIGDFNVPDYRGFFLRAVDAGRGIDPDAEQPNVRRTPAPGGSALGVGSIQADALKQHSHKIHIGPRLGGQPGAVAGTDDGKGVMFDDPFLPETVGGPETRPRNMAVNYIIKF